MRDSRTGDAVWSSGAAFLLLHTVDGWRHLTNITPLAVPTAGGLTVASSSGELVVAALPFDRLLVSPFLRAPLAGITWVPEDTPGALAAGRQSVAFGPRGVTALLRAGGGTAVERGKAGWAVLTDASRLAPGGHVHLDGLSWGAGGRGWLTGHGPVGSPVAFSTNDFGRTWAAVAGLAPDAEVALTPCGGNEGWTMPVEGANGTIALAASKDGGVTWSTGAPLMLPLGQPAWGCHGTEVWLLGGAADGDRVYSSMDAGLTWKRQALAPEGLTDLAPTGGHEGFASSATTNGVLLWSVSGSGASFAPMVLPGWVATVGNQMTSHD